MTSTLQPCVAPTETGLPYGQDSRELGIIAGAGKFPRMVAEGARAADRTVTIIGLRGLAAPELAAVADRFYWSGIARPGSWIRRLRRIGAGSVILAGSVRKTDMYGRFRLLKALPDWTAIRLWFFTVTDKRNDTILSAVAQLFARNGITMDECVKYCGQHMAQEGVLTAKQPSASQMQDARLGWKVAKELGRLDVGQSVAVKETEIIAVEAIEGTDRMIERAGMLCPRGGWTLVKVAKPKQDMRFDVPTVGPQTIEKLQAQHARMLVVEAGKTVVIDREQMVRQADAAGIVVVAMTGVDSE